MPKSIPQGTADQRNLHPNCQTELKKQSSNVQPSVHKETWLQDCLICFILSLGPNGLRFFGL